MLTGGAFAPDLVERVARWCRDNRASPPLEGSTEAVAVPSELLPDAVWWPDFESDAAWMVPHVARLARALSFDGSDALLVGAAGSVATPPLPPERLALARTRPVIHPHVCRREAYCCLWRCVPRADLDNITEVASRVLGFACARPSARGHCGYTLAHFREDLLRAAALACTDAATHVAFVFHEHDVRGHCGVGCNVGTRKHAQ